jgi:hypothetical protein
MRPCALFIMALRSPGGRFLSTPAGAIREQLREQILKKGNDYNEEMNSFHMIDPGVRTLLLAYAIIVAIV